MIRLLSALMTGLLAGPFSTLAKDATSPDASPMESTLEKATFAAGCFWCVEAVFEKQDGVQSVVSGYTGGRVEHPTYDAVCSGRTGHAEAVEITFDPAVVSYADLLTTLWKAHDPTTLNKQGADVGTQYRSAIYYHSEAQKQTAEISKKAAAQEFSVPIVTEITQAEIFYPAEEVHQDYYARNPDAGYCSFVIRPKLKKLGL